MATLEKRGDWWTIRWTEPKPGGEGRRWRRHRVRTRRQAEKLRIEIEDAVRIEGSWVPAAARPLSTPLSEVIEAFLAHSDRSNAPSTTLRKRQMLKLLTRHLGDEARVDGLSYESLGGFHAWLRNPETGRHLHGRGPETCRKIIGEVELMWRWASIRQARGQFRGVPAPDSLDLKRAAAPEAQAPTWAEMDACIHAANGWQKRLYIVLRCTGLRVGQAMGLQWSDLDLDKGILRFRGELGKTKHERRGRRQPLAPVLLEPLREWDRRSEWIIECPRRERVARARDAARAWHRAGIPEEKWAQPHHAFRKGWATGLQLAGVDKEAIEYMQGHQVGHLTGLASSRDRYLDPRALPLVEAVGQVPPIARMLPGGLFLDPDPVD
ncbi:MAG: tyrosine-type recombinase/integrase [Myxococcota bacterium]